MDARFEFVEAFPRGGMPSSEPMIFGRDDERAHLSDLLDDWSLVSIVGPGGVGKTTLARAVATTTGSFDFVDLTAMSGVDLKDSIAGELGYSSFSDLEHGPTDERLLVLDNCEHLIDDIADFVDDYLQVRPGPVLATTREPLGVSGERIYRLLPISTEGDPSPAGRFLRESLRTRGLTEEFDSAELDILAAQLDGLPLALELAAARLTSMSPTEVREHLRDRLDLLSRRRARGPNRHRSLNAAIAWSYDLLEEERRDGLRRLSIFDGPFNLACAAAATNSTEAETLDLLGALVERSLVTTTLGAGQMWYRLYDTVRVFCREQGSEDDAQAAIERVVSKSVELAEALTFPREREHRLDIQQSVAALFPIWREAIAWCMDQDEDPTRVLAMVSPLWWMEDVGHQLEVAELIERALNRWPGPMSESRALATAVQATLLRVAVTGPVPWEKTEAVLKSDLGGLSTALAYRTAGMIRRSEGEFAEANEYLAAGAAAARDIGYEALEAEIEMHVALGDARIGMVDGAVARMESILERETVSGLTRTWLMTMLAYIQLGSNPDEALDLLEALASGEAGPLDPWSEGSVQEQLGYLRAANREISVAAEHLLQAFDTFDEHHILPGLYLTCEGAAALFAQLGMDEWEHRSLATARQLYGSPSTGPFEEELYERIAGHPKPTPKGRTSNLSGIRLQLERLVDGSDPGDTNETPTQAAFTQEGDTWRVAFQGTEALVRDSKGMVDLAKLLASPRQEIGALDLMGTTFASGNTGEVIDAEGRSRFRKRIRELSDEIEDAESMGRDEKAERLRIEMDQIASHLGAAYGLGGRARTEGDAAEKARSAVTWRIRSAIKRIADANPGAGDHLDRFVSTGRFCVYDPPTPITWLT